MNALTAFMAEDTGLPNPGYAQLRIASRPGWIGRMDHSGGLYDFETWAPLLEYLREEEKQGR